MNHADESVTHHAAGVGGEVVNDHERTDADAGPIYYYGAGMFLLVVVAFVLMALMFVGLDAYFGTPTGVQAAPEIPPQPTLEVSPGMNLGQIRQEEAGALENFGWVNQEQGIVRVPIEKAMEMYVEGGFRVAPAGGSLEPAVEAAGAAR